MMIIIITNVEFAKLRASCTFARSCLTFFRGLCTFVPYAPSRLTCLTCAPYLHALFTCLARLTYVPDLCPLCSLFAHLKIFLRWICSPSKDFNFPRIIKVTTDSAVFMRVEKEL